MISNLTTNSTYCKLHSYQSTNPPPFSPSLPYPILNSHPTRELIPSNKDRLYVSLHAREIPTPTADDNTGLVFARAYEERSCAVDTMVLVWILIGKVVVDRDRVVRILRGISLRCEGESR